MIHTLTLSLTAPAFLLFALDHAASGEWFSSLFMLTLAVASAGVALFTLSK